MIRDITIGQYYNADSPIHRMDPRTKILWTVFYMVLLFCINSPVQYFAVILFTAFVIHISKVPFRFMIRGLKPIVFIILFTALLNLFMSRGGSEIFRKGIFVITDYGLYMALKMSVRIILLILGSSLLTLTTTPTVLTGGLEILMSPLSKIGIPVQIFVMMMSIALRFIPTLLDETDKIMKAQMSRGADFETGNLLQRVKAMLPILIPLFVSAFRRADELAVAMECRCYNCDAKRTSYRRYKFAAEDKKALICAVLLLLTTVIIKVVL